MNENKTVELKGYRTADSFLTLFMGLMGKKREAAQGGLLLKKCSSIHTCFMRFPIDVYYLASDGTVLYKECVKPWRIGRIVKHTVDILEIPSGNDIGAEVGDRIYFM